MFLSSHLINAAVNATVAKSASPRLQQSEIRSSCGCIKAPELRGMPDSALLFGAYKKWGVDCVDHLLGDFVFAAWDAKKNL